MNLSWIWKAFILGVTTKYVAGDNAVVPDKPYDAGCNNINFMAGFKGGFQISKNPIPSYKTRNDFLNCAPSGRQSYIDCGVFGDLMNLCKKETLQRRVDFDDACAKHMVNKGLEFGKSYNKRFNPSGDSCVQRYNDKFQYNKVMRRYGAG